VIPSPAKPCPPPAPRPKSNKGYGRAGALNPTTRRKEEGLKRRGGKFRLNKPRDARRRAAALQRAAAEAAANAPRALGRKLRRGVKAAAAAAENSLASSDQAPVALVSLLPSERSLVPAAAAAVALRLPGAAWAPQSDLFAAVRALLACSTSAPSPLSVTASAGSAAQPGLLFGEVDPVVLRLSFGGSRAIGSAADALSLLPRNSPRERLNEMAPGGGALVSLRELAATPVLFVNEQLSRDDAQRLFSESVAPVGLALLHWRLEMIITRSLLPREASGRMLRGERVLASGVGTHVDGNGGEAALICVRVGIKIVHFARATLANGLALAAGAHISSLEGYGYAVVCAGQAFLILPGMVHCVVNVTTDSVAVSWHGQIPGLALPLLGDLLVLLRQGAAAQPYACQFARMLMDDGKGAAAAPLPRLLMQVEAHVRALEALKAGAERAARASAARSRLPV